jgi:NhaP-type Na+/H+ or K+/H+ antiporter
MFSNEVFFTFILPPIIFAAGYSLRKSLFFQNLGLITFLGIFGTIFSFVALSACINFFNNIFFDHLLSISEVMLLSSVLCATDTVTALSLIKVNNISQSQKKLQR